MEIELICPICTNIFDDPCTLRCGHSFCATCITLWKETSAICPQCRAPMRSANLSRSIVLAAVVARFHQETHQSQSCCKCHCASGPITSCGHCRLWLCRPCSDKHVTTLHSHLQESQKRVESRIKPLEARLHQLMNTQTQWSRVQQSLTELQSKVTAALTHASSQTDLLSAQTQSLASTIRTARESLAQLQGSAAATANAVALGRGIETADRLAGSLDSAAESGGPNAEKADGAERLASQLAACFEANSERPAELADETASAASPEQYYAGFPEEPSVEFEVEGSVWRLAACWNTRGFLSGGGRIVSAATAAREGGQFDALPDEVVIVLSAESPVLSSSRISVFDTVGNFKGRIDLRLPDGSSETGDPTYISVSSAQQLLAASIFRSHRVLLTRLDGSAQLLITSCSGQNLENPLAVCLTDDDRLFIADRVSLQYTLQNCRVRCVSCRSGDTVADFSDGSLGAVYQLAVFNSLVFYSDMNGRIFTLDERQPRQAPNAVAELSRCWDFFTDSLGGLMVSENADGGGSQLLRIPQPQDGGADGARQQLLRVESAEYWRMAALRDGRVVACDKESMQIHIF